MKHVNIYEQRLSYVLSFQKIFSSSKIYILFIISNIL